MKQTDFDGLMVALEEARAFLDGSPVPGTVVHTIHVETVDVRAIRAKLKLSRPKFAAAFGLDPRTVQEWEQGRRRPDRAAQSFLKVIARNPQAVREALDTLSPETP